MLLTFKPSLHDGIASPNVRSSWSSSSYTTDSTLSTAQNRPADSPRPPPRTSVHASQPPPSAPRDQVMDTSQRNLPSAPVNLPPPEQIGHMASISSLPPPPAPWQRFDESMRHWLAAKAEEDRRRQEEERTRQESLRLDQRKVEQTMLRDSLQAGVPPYMVPFIFASLGGGNLQWAQQYISQMAQLQSASLPGCHHLSPTQPSPPANTAHSPLDQSKPHPLGGEIPRDNRSIPPNPYAAHSLPVPQPKQPSPSQGLHNRSGPAALSRITNGEILQHHQFSAQSNSPEPSSVSGTTSQPQKLRGPPKKDAQQEQSHQNSSSSIHFYHWVPPGQSQTQPETPSGGTPNTSPSTSHPHSHLRTDHHNSPKKRKAQGPHQQAPPPSSQLIEQPSSSRPRARAGSTGSRGTNHVRSKSGTPLAAHEAAIAAPRDPKSQHEQVHRASGSRNGEPGIIVWQSQRSETPVGVHRESHREGFINTPRRYEAISSTKPNSDGGSGGGLTRDGDKSKQSLADAPHRILGSGTGNGSFYHHSHLNSTASSPARPIEAHATAEEHRSRSPSHVAMPSMSYDRIRPSPAR
ncbi:hypothetical protein VTO42DRAFT_5869 [Malbranchea cinnamomea]